MTTQHHTLSLHDALPISRTRAVSAPQARSYLSKAEEYLSAAEDELQTGRAIAATSLVRARRSEEHTSELQSLAYLVCRLLLEKKNFKRSTGKWSLLFQLC